MKGYLQRLKNKNMHTSGTAKTAKSQKVENIELPKLPKAPFDSKDSCRERHIFKNRLDQLLSEVGAIVTEDGQGIRFKSYLAGPEIDPERWMKALELEELFFETEI